MGRHLWLRGKASKFLWKMLRLRAASLYGWDIRGRHRLAGRHIGAGNEAVIRAAASESRARVGLRTGPRVGGRGAAIWPQERLALEVERSLLGSSIIGRPVTCSTVAGWRADQRVVKAKESFDFLQQRLSRHAAVSAPARQRRLWYGADRSRCRPGTRRWARRWISPALTACWTASIAMRACRSIPFTLKWKALPTPPSVQ